MPPPRSDGGAAHGSVNESSGLLDKTGRNGLPVGANAFRYGTGSAPSGSSSTTDEDDSQSDADEDELPQHMWFLKTVLVFVRVCEAVSLMQVMPYVRKMAYDFNVPRPEMWAGLLSSAFTMSEAATSPLWGWLSDRVGRKPVLLSGVFFTSLFMLMFGMSPNITVALIARAGAGAMNGNGGIVNRTAHELVKGRKKAGVRIMFLLQIIWATGTAIAGAVGGYLVYPDQWMSPSFPFASFFYRHKYLPPNLVVALVVMFSFMVGLFFLPETNPSVAGRRDIPLEIGKGVMRRFGADPAKYYPDYRIVNSPANESSAATTEPPTTPTTTKSSVWKRLQVVPPVIFLLAAIIFFLGLHTFSIEHNIPILFETARALSSVSLPFKFSGGLGWTTRQVGLYNAFLGLAQIVSHFTWSRMVAHLDHVRTVQKVMIMYSLAYILTPYVAVLPVSGSYFGAAAITTYRVVGQSLSFPIINSITNVMAPAKHGGLCSSIVSASASMGRSVGPPLVGVLYLYGMKYGYMITSWWFMSAIAAASFVISLNLKPLAKDKKLANGSSRV